MFAGSPTAYSEPRLVANSGVRGFIERFKWLTVAARISVEAASPALRRMRSARTCGATHAELSPEESVSYIEWVYEDYLRYATIGPQDTAGAHVLEVGPGDNFGVALRLLADGAARVTTLDRFVTRRDAAQQAEIYRRLLDRLGEPERRRAESAVSFEAGEVKFDESRLQVIEGVGIESAASRLAGGSVDLIVSRAVLEHVYELGAAFEAMDSVLRPGGTMVHKIDLRDHGMFTRGGHHPLTFLTIPDRLYRWMGEANGIPNRRMIGDYRSDVRDLGYDAGYLVTHLVGEQEEIVPATPEAELGSTTASREAVDSIRPKLLARYRELPGETLEVAGFFLIARKPAETP